MHEKKPPEKTLEQIIAYGKAAVPYAFGIAAAVGAWEYIELAQLASSINYQVSDILFSLNTASLDESGISISEYVPLKLVLNNDTLSWGKAYVSLMNGIAARSALLTALRKRSKRKVIKERKQRQQPKKAGITEKVRTYFSNHPVIGAVASAYAFGAAALGVEELNLPDKIEKLDHLEQHWHEFYLSSIAPHICSQATAVCEQLRVLVETNFIANVTQLGVLGLCYPVIKLLFDSTAATLHPGNKPVLWMFESGLLWSGSQRDKLEAVLHRFQKKLARERIDSPNTRTTADILQSTLYFRVGNTTEGLKKLSSGLEAMADAKPDSQPEVIVLTNSERRYWLKAFGMVASRGKNTLGDLVEQLLSLDQEVYIERDLSALHAKHPESTTILSLQYLLYNAQNRQRDVDHVLKKIMSITSRTHGIPVRGTILRYQNKYLDWQFATKVGKWEDLERERQRTLDLQPAAAGVPGLSLATPVAIIEQEGVVYYMMKLDRGQELAQRMTNKQELLERAAQFIGRYHALHAPEEPPTDYFVQVKKRVNGSRVIDAPVKESVGSAVDAIAGRYPALPPVAQRDSHQKNYIVVTVDDAYKFGDAHKFGKQRLVAIDFGFSRVYTPEIDLAKLLEMGVEAEQETQREQVIAVYAGAVREALGRKRARQTVGQAGSEELMLRTTAITPLVFLSYACWGEAKSHTSTMREVFRHNTLRSIERMKNLFPAEYKRLSPAYDTLAGVISSLPSPSPLSPGLAASGNKAL
ncbi:aminoglycoside phosphotransferase family protein [Candidatus Woesearchaeota archaeon]|nr:aminoglycoside phosphotransferase family protein [Candidatus Woesearchaeota archaeon]